MSEFVAAAAVSSTFEELDESFVVQGPIFPPRREVDPVRSSITGLELDVPDLHARRRCTLATKIGSALLVLNHIRGDLVVRRRDCGLKARHRNARDDVGPDAVSIGGERVFALARA